MKQEKRHPKYFIGQYVKCKFPDKAIMYGKIKGITTHLTPIEGSKEVNWNYIYSIENSGNHSLFFAEESLESVNAYPL